ncbi:cupin domain-containing protein [Ahrensia marina]|nr:cupin domain-containing protein [Ahrensia marina]
MTIKFDNLDALISGYVAGSLPLPLHVMMASQLELSGQHRSLVRALEAAAGNDLEELSPVAVSKRDETLAQIFKSDEDGSGQGETSTQCDVMPSALVGFTGFSVNDIPWKTKLPGFKEFDLGTVDGCEVSLFWIRPGRTVPMHKHEGKELSLILQGAFTDERGVFARGDISIADENVEHRPTADMSAPCIGFAVTDGPQRLSGSFKQRIGDILGAY